MQDVKPSETSNPLLVREPSCPCAGEVEAVEEPPGFLGKEGSQDSWWDRSSKATLGALSHPKCLWELPGPSCPNAWKTTWNHLSGRQSLFQRLPKEDLVSFHVIPPPGSVLDQQLPLEPWMAGAGPRSGVWCLPSTLSLVLGTFWDFSGVEE